MIERPQPPATHHKDSSERSIGALRDEIRQMKQDISFLKGLLEHLRGEFARLKKQ